MNKPIIVVKSHDDSAMFETKCAELLSAGYILQSTSSAATGECQDIVYIAIFHKPIYNSQAICTRINGQDCPLNVNNGYCIAATCVYRAVDGYANTNK